MAWHPLREIYALTDELNKEKERVAKLPEGGDKEDVERTRMTLESVALSLQAATQNIRQQVLPAVPLLAEGNNAAATRRLEYIERTIKAQISHAREDLATARKLIDRLFLAGS